MSFKTFLASSSAILNACRKASYISMYYIGNISVISLSCLYIYIPKYTTTSNELFKIKQRIGHERLYKFN